MRVAVLFARADSIYKTMPDCDVFDIERDARNYKGHLPVIAHPPCRSWGLLASFAKPRPDEKELAPWAVELIRKNGGVLEHPAGSKLWPYMNLPEPGNAPDQFGGWSIGIHQHWFGHRAEKKTKLYIVGCKPGDMPEMPMTLSYPTHVVGGTRAKIKRPEVSKSEREHTPRQLAEWLCKVATRCKRMQLSEVAA